MAIDLGKQSAKVKFALSKRKINDIPCQVKFIMDCSGSAEWLYKNGTIQNVTNMIFPIAFTVDMDKLLDFFIFDSGCKAIETPVDQHNFETFIEKYVMKKAGWGGTNYAPFVKAVVDSVKPEAGKKGLFGFGKKEAKPADPVFAIVITDGENYDETAAERAFKESVDKNIYWMLVGIGRANFSFIERMGKKYPNVGYLPLTDLAAVSDEDLYDGLINDEFAAWVTNFTA
jgi:hypothetical protein